jgi:hypothetical protein
MKMSIVLGVTHVRKVFISARRKECLIPLSR